MPMREIILLFIVVCFVVVEGISQGNSQANFQKNGLAFSLLGVDIYSPWKGELYNFDEFTFGVEVGYSRKLNQFFSLNFPIQVGKMDYPISEAELVENHFFASVDATIHYNFQVKSDNFLQPYIFTGIGTAYVSEVTSNWERVIPVGLGFKVKLSKNIFLQLQSAYRFSSGPDRWHNGIGVYATFGNQTAKKINLSVKGGNDQDQDGIKDIKDDCPSIVGLQRFNGCPDSDKDGLPDVADDCPNEPGHIDLEGCPVNSWDSVTNYTYLILVDFGKDSDGDGLRDGEDKCPQVAGRYELGGCPDINENNHLDTDGDGIKNQEDECPKIAGIHYLKGCPDTDYDGVTDRVDKCPYDYGLVEHFGCPPDEPIELAVKIPIPYILFSNGDSQLRLTDYDILDRIFELLQQNSGYHISIEGHTDGSGSFQTNQRISEARARACYEYLLRKGIAENRMLYIGYADKRPVKSVRNELDKNRRVEFKVFLKTK